MDAFKKLLSFLGATIVIMVMTQAGYAAEVVQMCAQ